MQCKYNTLLIDLMEREQFYHQKSG